MNSKRILLIEEQPDIANLLWAYLSEQGYEVQIAKSQDEAITLLYRSLPCLIILSSAIPIKEDKILERLRQIQLISHVPILFLTPHIIEDRIAGGFDRIDDYMIKPIDIEELRLRVKNSFDRTDRNRELNFFDGLATRKLINKYLAHLIKHPNDRSWTYFDLKIHNMGNFYELNEEKANNITLRFLGFSLIEAIHKFGTDDDTIAHDKDDSFQIITFTSNPQNLEKYLVDAFEKLILNLFLYPNKPKLSIGKTSKPDQPFTTVQEVIDLATKLRDQTDNI